MTEQPTEGGGLSREDVAALRKADSVTFHRTKGEAYLRACLDRHIDDTTKALRALFPVFRDERNRDRRIEATDGIGGYDGNRRWWVADDDVEVRCFYMLHHADMSTEWQTIAAQLRPGDTLRLRWLAGNDNENLERAGMHRDELRLMVTDSRGKGRAYLVAIEVGPDNSARMIKRHGL